MNTEQQAEAVAREWWNRDIERYPGIHCTVARVGLRLLAERDELKRQLAEACEQTSRERGYGDHERREKDRLHELLDRVGEILDGEEIEPNQAYGIEVAAKRIRERADTAEARVAELEKRLAEAERQRDQWKADHKSVLDALEKAESERDSLRFECEQWVAHSKDDAKRHDELMEKYREAEARARLFESQRGDLATQRDKAIAFLNDAWPKLHAALDEAAVPRPWQEANGCEYLRKRIMVLRQRCQTLEGDVIWLKGERQALQTQVNAATAALDKVCPQKDGSLQNKVDWAVGEIRVTERQRSQLSETLRAIEEVCKGEASEHTGAILNDPAYRAVSALQRRQVSAIKQLADARAALAAKRRLPEGHDWEKLRRWCEQWAKRCGDFPQKTYSIDTLALLDAFESDAPPAEPPQATPMAPERGAVPLRDWFADSALAWLLDQHGEEKSASEIAVISYEVADAMLAARDNQKP